MTVVGMILIVGLVVLASLVIRWIFSQPASSSANPNQGDPDARTEGN